MGLDGAEVLEGFDEGLAPAGLGWDLDGDAGGGGGGVDAVDAPFGAAGEGEEGVELWLQNVNK